MYPFKIKSSRKFIDELTSCEMGSHEDTLQARADGVRYRDITVVEILSRHPAMIEVRNEQERELLIYALRTGTINIYVNEKTIDRVEMLLVCPDEAPVKPKRNNDMKTMTHHTKLVIEAAVELGLIDSYQKKFVDRFQILKGRSEFRCTGGIKAGRIPMVRYGKEWQCDSDMPIRLTEYARIADDPEIGTIAGSYAAPMALACHEVAHAIVLWNEWGMPKREKSDAHGGRWRRTYRALRKHFGVVSPVNQHIGEVRRTTAAA